MSDSSVSLIDEEVITFRKTTKKTKDFLESSDEELMNDCHLHSTPLDPERQEFELFKRRIDETISTHKANLKRFRDEGKANNEEFLNVLNIIVRGETPDFDNVTDHQEVLWNGENLMSLYAGPEPTKFGRQLAVKMFGAKDTCLLKTHIIGPVKGRRESRTPISEEGRKTFEGNL